MFEYIGKVLKSWTVWFNGVIATVWAFAEFGIPQLVGSLPMLQGVVDPSMYGKLLISVTVVNILLRFKTNSAISDK